MQQRIRAFGRGLLDRWNLLQRGQKIKLSLTAAILLVTLGATIFIMTRPQWVVLVNNKSAAETGAIEEALTTEGIAVRINNNATGVSVRAQDKDRASIVLSDNRALNNIDFTFQDALGASGMGSTERVKNEAFRRAFLSELSDKLSLYDWIDSASVDVVFPEEDNFFVRSQDRPTAAVLLITNRTPNEVQATNVARLISRSVKNLSMDDIEITDQNAQALYSGLQVSMGSIGSEHDVLRQRENEIDARVRSMLIPLFSEVKTIPNLVIDWDKTETVRTEYSSPDPDSAEGVPTKRRTENQQVTGGSTDAEPGVAPNAMTTYNTGETEQSSAQSKISEEELIYNEIQQRIESGGGSVVYEQSSFGICVYKYRHYDQKYMEDNDLLNGQSWQEFVNTTSLVETPLVIDPNLIDNLRVATRIQNLSMIGFEVPVFHDYVEEPVKIEQYIIFGILALLILLLAYGLIRRTQKDEVLELEPELTVEHMLVSSQLEEEKEEEDELVPIGIVTESESRQQINKFIDERPEVVAALLRNWLNEDWE